MKRISLFRLFPLLMAGGLLALVWMMWPAEVEEAGLLPWLNIVLLLGLALLLLRYGLRVLKDRFEPPPGSRLRAKLVVALVSMLLVPSSVIQLAAGQMVEHGMDVWFDVRVDTLLERALRLAQGFYARIETDMKRRLLDYISDAVLVAAVEGRIDYRHVNAYLAELREREGWDKAQLFDINERLLAVSQKNMLGALQAAPLSDNARLSMHLARITTELISNKDGEFAIGYAPIVGATAVKGLLRVELALPSGVIQDARSSEADYRRYKQLERNRQSIRELFAHVMLLVTLIVVLIAGLIALWFARRLTTPIGELAHALRQVTEGNLDITIPEAPQDELGSLARSFNEMVGRLRQNARAIDKAQQEIREALASSRHRQHVLETLLANLHSGVLLIDAEGRLRLLNQSAREILHLPAKWVPGIEFLGCCEGALLPLRDFYEELRLLQEGHLQREFELHLTKGSTVHVLVRGVRLSASEASGFSGFLLVIDDISELVEAQRSRAWAEVARRLAHEIKNPLTPIKLAAERLQRRFREQVDDHDVFDGCTQAIITQVERLQRLIADFSALARMPQPKIRAMRAGTLLQEMRELFSTYPRVRVDPAHGELVCHCDPDQIRQGLINLLDNAIAATREDQQVRLFVRPAGEHIEWIVEDEGAGIDAEHADRIFDSYFSTKADGSGLGLSIARRIATDHGGELLLLSRKNPTRFCLRLPLRSATEEGR